MEGVAAQSLRSLVHDCLAKHMYDAAAFYADKMVSLSGYSPAEVYTLAQAFYCARQFRRCLQLLRGTELIEKDVRFRFLAARCGVARGGGPAASEPVMDPHSKFAGRMPPHAAACTAAVARRVEAGGVQGTRVDESLPAYRTGPCWLTAKNQSASRRARPRCL